MINSLIGIIRLFYNPAADVEVIVLGHQKGGTTAIAALLGKISAKEVSNDPLYEVDLGKAEILTEVVNYPGKITSLCLRYPSLFSKPIVKDPDLIYIYQAVKECYENARFLFVVRDPRDTIRSICNRLALTGDDLNRVPSLKEMQDGNHHWELVLSGKLPKSEGRGYSSLVSNLAYRWNLASKIYLEFSSEMILLRYEDFLQDKERVIGATANKLGLECTESIADSIDVQYQPKGNSDTDLQGFFDQENLEQIEVICADSMREFGYEFLTNANS